MPHKKTLTNSLPLCGLGMVVLWPNRRRTPPHADGRGSTAPTPRQVVGTSFEGSWPPRTNLVTSGLRAVCPVEYRPTAHEMCAPCSADLAWLCCGPTQGALLPRRRPGLDRTNTAIGRGTACKRLCGRRVQISWRTACAALLVPWSIGRPSMEYSRRAVRTCHGRVVGQRGARSSPLIRPGRGSTSTAIARRQSFRMAVATVFEFRGARPARFLSRGIPADRPLSTRATQCGLGVVVLWANEGRCRRPSLGRTNTATGRRHGVLKVAAVALGSHGERPVRFSRLKVTADRSQSTRAALCRLCVAMCPTRGALLPAPTAEARPHQHHDRTAARRLRTP